ncbi:MAG: hypothetical protein SGILL_010804, partial [Bacillariaceae sp.]
RRLFHTSSPILSSVAEESPPKIKHFLPKRLILIRHGESMGNQDETAYASIADWRIPLTRRGERQSMRASKQLDELLAGEKLFTYYSPYKRARETWDIIADYLENSGQVELVGAREEPRISEQQFGNYQNPHKVRTAKAERKSFGRFYFRFPNGESGLDVYNRISSFLGTLSRDIRQLDEMQSWVDSFMEPMDIADRDPLKNTNILIVCHGLTLRLLLMRKFQLSVEEFENSYNSQNAKLVILDRVVDSKSGREFYRLQEEAKQALNLKGDVSNQRPVFMRTGYKEDSAVGRGLRILEEDSDMEE